MTVVKKRRSMIRRDTKPPVWTIVEKLACYKSCPSIFGDNVLETLALRFL